MRLCTTRPPAPRTWTVELRSQPQGPLLVCTQCALAPETLHGRSARSAALAHLARHARCSLLPQHLRTCQCHERGCRWHSRHRGCDGPLLLVLSREHGGRLWRLADTCTACAHAMKDASIVPDTTLTATLRPTPRPGRGSARKEGVEQDLVRDMLSYLAASLPQSVSPRGRILALQCVLRADPDGHLQLPCGLVRGMRLPQPETARQELTDSGWIRPYPGHGDTIAGRLTDPLAGSLGSRRRRQAADWALRVIQSGLVARLAPAPRLLALAIAAHTPPGETAGRAEADQLARRCGLSHDGLIGTLPLLASQRAVTFWELAPDAVDLVWSTSPPHASARGLNTPRAAGDVRESPSGARSASTTDTDVR